MSRLGGGLARDRRNLRIYNDKGWKVPVIWECALKGRMRLPIDEVIHAAANGVQFDSLDGEIARTEVSSHLQ